MENEIKIFPFFCFIHKPSLESHGKKKARDKHNTCFTGSDATIYIYEFRFMSNAQCLKITEKVSFNIASEASYIYMDKS